VVRSHDHREMRYASLKLLALLRSRIDLHVALFWSRLAYARPHRSERLRHSGAAVRYFSRCACTFSIHVRYTGRQIQNSAALINRHCLRAQFLRNAGSGTYLAVAWQVAEALLYRGASKPCGLVQWNSNVVVVSVCDKRVKMWVL